LKAELCTEDRGPRWEGKAGPQDNQKRRVRICCAHAAQGWKRDLPEVAGHLKKLIRNWEAVLRAASGVTEEFERRKRTAGVPIFE
jgi:hypothetical protein